MVNRFRYYPALKTLEQLEHTYLPRVETHWFSQTMKEAIPKLRERIKDASMSDLKDFLESIRNFSARIGEIAMKHVGFRWTKVYRFLLFNRQYTWLCDKFPLICILIGINLKEDLNFSVLERFRSVLCAGQVDRIQNAFYLFHTCYNIFY